VSNPEKTTTIEEIKDRLGSSKIAILTDFQDLNVAEMTELRKLLRGSGIDYKVYKNTLTRIAAEELGIVGIEKYLTGTTALAFSKSDDFVTPTKIVKDFGAKHQRFKVKAGVLNKKAVSSEDVFSLTSLPPREFLVAMVLGGRQTLVSKLLSLFQAPMREFAGLLRSLAEIRTGESAVDLPSQADTKSEEQINESEHIEDSSDNQINESQ